MSSHVPTLKHKVEQQLLTWKQLFQLLQETNSFFQFIIRCLTLCFSVGTWGDTTNLTLSETAANEPEKAVCFKQLFKNSHTFWQEVM